MMKQRIIIGFLCICLASMAFAQERIRIEHGPYLQNLKETETTIVWMASKPSVGWVELAPDDGSTYYQKEREKFFDTTNGVKNTGSSKNASTRANSSGSRRTCSGSIDSHNDG